MSRKNAIISFCFDRVHGGSGPSRYNCGTRWPFWTFRRFEKILPHRYPFLLIDRILELEDMRVVGIKNVTMNEPHFTGHFPNHR